MHLLEEVLPCNLANLQSYHQNAGSPAHELWSEGRAAPRLADCEAGQNAALLGVRPGGAAAALHEDGGAALPRLRQRWRSGQARRAAAVYGSRGGCRGVPRK